MGRQLGMILTLPYTFTAVYAIFGRNDSLAVPNAYGFRRTAFYTVYAALTLRFVQMDGRVEF